LKKYDFPKKIATVKPAILLKNFLTFASLFEKCHPNGVAVEKAFVQLV
jgi:hypothetical protein